MSVRISVAMATFNGEQYLRAQLDSLEMQRYKPSELVVCDDGSSDQTVEILREFRNVASFPVRIYQNKENLGYANNFLKAARRCRGDWISFCDQDDVWLPCKLEQVRDVIIRGTNAIMICQKAYLANADLRHNAEIFPRSSKVGFFPPRSIYGFWVWPGCMKSIRSDMLETFCYEDRPGSYNPYEGLQTHDKWTCMIANCLGGVEFIDGASMLYRRHGCALTGDYLQLGVRERISRSIGTASDHFSYLSAIARESADYLSEVDMSSSAYLADLDLRLGVDMFEKIEKFCFLRSLVRGHSSTSERFVAYMRILLGGGYLGTRSVAFGWRGAISDACFLLSRSFQF